MRSLLLALLLSTSTVASAVSYFDTIDSPDLLGGLPIKSITPGFINPDVTQETIGSTICIPGWSASIRPPSKYTSGLKYKQLQMYLRPKDEDVYPIFQKFEEDHLIPLSSGGHPSDPRNLWPEPRLGKNGAAMKDRLELLIHRMICDGKISLEDGQKVFYDNWVTSYYSYYPSNK